jgi:hypothetical protein
MRKILYETQMKIFHLFLLHAELNSNPGSSLIPLVEFDTYVCLGTWSICTNTTTYVHMLPR